MNTIDNEFYSYKNDYFDLLEREHVKQPLTPFEAEYKDYWSEKNIGSSKYAYMFDLLITNVEYAMREGYYTVS